MSSDSTPFAIRTQLLNLAKDVLSENMHAKAEYEKATYSSGGVKMKKPGDIKPYTTEDIIQEAEKLYAFVSKR